MIRTAVWLAAALMLSGCFGLGGQSCAKPKPYQQSRLTEPVKIPEGLDDLDERRDLEIPPAATPPGAAEGRCLEEPPPFSERMAEIRDEEED